MNRLKLAINTDIVVEYLLHHGPRVPALRVAMMKFFCYTTVFNAIELFALAPGDGERSAVNAALGAMKILGLNAKQSPRYGAWFAEHPGLKPVSVLIAGLCVESKLPLLTNDTKSFRGFHGLRIIKGSAMRIEETAESILSNNRGEA